MTSKEQKLKELRARVLKEYFPEQALLLEKLDDLAKVSDKEFGEYFKLLSEKIDKLISVNSVQPPAPIVNCKDVVIPEFPKETKILNLNEVVDGLKKELNKLDKETQKVKFTNTKIEIRKIDTLIELLEKIASKNLEVNIKENVIEFPKDPKNPIAVRLSDGKKFYNAVISAISSAGMSGKAETNLENMTFEGGKLRTTATISGDVIVDNVGLENIAGEKINPATETTLQAINSKTISNPATAANQLPDGHNVTARGNVAAGTADSGNPVKSGGVFRATPPTYGDGQRTDVHTDSRGTLKVVLSPGDNLQPFLADNADGVAATGTAATPSTVNRLTLFNGATWDRARGDIANGLDVDVTRSALPAGASTEATLQAINNKTLDLDSYAYFGAAEDATFHYIGRQDRDGRWVILRINKTTRDGLYANGVSGMVTAWANRATQTYREYAEAF